MPEWSDICSHLNGFALVDSRHTLILCPFNVCVWEKKGIDLERRNPKAWCEEKKKEDETPREIERFWMTFELPCVIYVKVMLIFKVSIHYIYIWLWTSIHDFYGTTFQSHFNWEQIYILLDSTTRHPAPDFNAHYDKRKKN